MMASMEREEWPTTVAGIDWRAIRKGDTIPHDQIIEAFGILFPDKPSDTEVSYKILDVRDWVVARRAEEGAPLVFRQTLGDLKALTDEQAVSYLNGQALAGLRKHKRHTNQMFTAIDVDNLSSHQKQTLETNQARHALIASAVDGARRQAVKLLQAGAKLPKLMPPEA
jgi:hypothetical protein